MNITLKPFKDVFLFSLIYPQNKDMMLAEWMLLNVRASAVTIPAMGGGGPFCVLDLESNFIGFM